MTQDQDDALPPPPSGYDPISEEIVAGPVSYAGARLVEWLDDYARLEADVTAAIINRQGYVHGGIHMILLDTVAGYAGTRCAYPGRWRRVVTVSLTTNFIGAASSGRLIAEGRVTGGGRKTYFADATVRDANGALLASGSGVFRYVGQGASSIGEPRPS
ncbi:MAG: PaaI family thioesterase [Neomegalonema sp.]|nr:PaaI family thioesterase [Neomegalonema sp.]